MGISSRISCTPLGDASKPNLGSTVDCTLKIISTLSLCAWLPCFASLRKALYLSWKASSMKAARSSYSSCVAETSVVLQTLYFLVRHSSTQSGNQPGGCSQAASAGGGRGTLRPQTRTTPPTSRTFEAPPSLAILPVPVARASPWTPGAALKSSRPQGWPSQLLRASCSIWTVVDVGSIRVRSSPDSCTRSSTSCSSSTASAPSCSIQRP
mmetsp:Transcript_57364/g.184302  ORF Transcript_57364/g.184302 Transcript_57364/m.184302 type:complete len:210 (+) Transcript_57364:671-1300(+)